MVAHARTSLNDHFLVATEVGMLHRLRFEMPEKLFEPLREDAVCRYMKMTTLESVRDSLVRRQHVIALPRDISERARGAIERMVAIG